MYGKLQRLPFYLQPPGLTAYSFCFIVKPCVRGYCGGGSSSRYAGTVYSTGDSSEIHEMMNSIMRNGLQWKGEYVILSRPADGEKALLQKKR